MQDDIARSVAGALKLTLLGRETLGSGENQGNAQAYNLYLQGRYFSRRRSREMLEKGISYYEQALDIDPTFAPAWAGLARAHVNRAARGYVPFNGYPQARREISTALELDPDLAEAHILTAWIKLNDDWNWADAEKASKRARALDPGSLAGLGMGAMVAQALGDADEALALRQLAVERDPLSTTAQVYLGLRHWHDGALKKPKGPFEEPSRSTPSFPARTRRSVDSTW